MNPSPIDVDILIVGGGVIGLSLAWELSRRGRRVTLLEAGSLGRGASWAGAGILPPAARHGSEDPYEQLKSLSHNLHPQWAAQLHDLTDIDTGFRRCGGLYLARTAGELATLAANELWWEMHGIEFERWTPRQLEAAEPCLTATSELRAAWYLPDECQLRNPWHLKALVLACRRAGVQLLENRPVEHIDASDGVLVQAGEYCFRPTRTCICSGAWARQSLEQLGLPSGILPIRGQMLLYRSPTPYVRHIINEGHRYLVPRHDGFLLAGSIEEEVGYRIETTADGVQQIRRWAESVLPALAQHPIEKSWAGLRPGSFDSLPYLGAVPGRNDLYIAAGHFRSGLHLSPGTAQVMANLMTEQTSPIDLHPFRIGRG